MFRSRAPILALVLSVALAGGVRDAWAQEAEATEEEATVVVPDLPPPPYEARLLRLAEILGSVQYLRNLCSPEEETGWRDSMQALLNSETAGEADRREQLTAGYNRGFRAFASVYTSCTEAAVVAEERYRHEGATLVAEIVSRYGN
ncbi:signal peptide protein [Hoeflea sp. BAL378]|uniref:TIGR02301 family protein n=1 Tax=Hoeflea sp. BAL378 TaxID=1547437 RepID=UPI000514232A|nr:TIGR02301 family protein [Hoeflea sp. BAL378]KGF66731.1 signal peptide protein [Hoeflea sp. BAL378]